jgi:hypothetical protein
MMDAFDVSLDGTEAQHNWQRKNHKDYSEKNPYRKTFFNLMRLVKLGLSKKIKVQAAIQDQVADEEEKISFFENLVSIGVLFDNITYGGVHPTVKNPKVDEAYKDYLRSTTFWKSPCCEYRYMAHFGFNPDGSYDYDYFENVSESRSFNLSEFGKSYGIAEVEDIYRNKIQKNMSVMNDEVCMNKCPVLAYCWGRCHNNTFNLNNPSSHCNMRGLEEEVKKSLSQPI